MSVRKNSFKNTILLFLMIVFPASPWTIDLPEVRKYLFEKNDKLNKDGKGSVEIKDRYFYTNREGNSMHHAKHYEDVYENSPYAQEYGYQTYMEKKVNNIVHRGGQYLDGLQRSLEEYSKLLESCQKMNRTSTGSESTTWRPGHERNFTSESMNTTLSSCERATRASEHVRRLSQLALRATKDLQDLAYQRTYKKGDIIEVTMEENELILKLSWFLDRLAHYTGYEPDATPHEEEQRPSTTLPPITVPSLMNAPDDVKLRMMECLKQKSDVPATVRCAYPLPMPEVVKQIQRYTDEITSRQTPSSSNINEQVMPIKPEPELLIASETFAPNMTPLKREKRSENPAVNFLNHFTKTKAWIVENSEFKNNDQDFEVTNDLPTHVIHKRAVGKVSKKYQHFKVPEDPFQDLSKYIKHRPGVNYIKDDEQAAKIKAYFDKIHSKEGFVKKINKKFTYKRSINENDNSFQSKNYINEKNSLVQKRSVKFEQDVDKPRISEDPQQDISFYVKNKEGTNVENNLGQAILVRAGLEQVFQTGNIEVVHRYGANYNPLVPAPFYVAILKSMADNI